MPLPSLPSGGPVKLLVPLIAVVVGIGVAALVWSQLQQIKQLEQRLQLGQQQIQQLESQNQGLSRQVSALEGERKIFDERMGALRQELSSATASLDRSRSSLDELQHRYEELNGTRSKLESQLAGVTVERDEARKRTQQLEEEKTDLGRSVTRLRERLALLDRDYRQVAEQLTALQTAPRPGVNVVSATGPENVGSAAVGEKGAAMALSPGVVELPPIVVRKDQAGMSMPVRGRIVELNEPHQFIVVDKGSMDGVHVGMALDIVRGASTVGRATVVRVRPKLSACDIVRAKTSGPLQVGDAAVQSGP